MINWEQFLSNLNEYRRDKETRYKLKESKFIKYISDDF